MKTFMAVVLFVATALSAEEVVILHHGDPIPKDGVVCQFENDAVRNEFMKRIAGGEVSKEDPKTEEKAEKPAEVVKEEPKKEEEPKKVEGPKVPEPETSKPEALKQVKKAELDKKAGVYELDSDGVIVLHKGQKIPTANGVGEGPSFRYDSPETKEWFDQQPMEEHYSTGASGAPSEIIRRYENPKSFFIRSDVKICKSG